MESKFFLLTLVVLFTSTTTGKHPLYVGGLLELSTNWYHKYVNFFVHIFEYAFEEIENRTDILADYSLKLISKDTQVNILVFVN